MNDLGLVSIITPSYNCAKFICDTIESILAQTYQNWELLITDDCSTDNSRDVISEYCKKDSRIRLLCLSENSGAGTARNNSIKEAKGRFIAFCDSDDRWYPEKLERQLKFMTEKDCGMSYSSYMTCDENGEPMGIVVCRHSETLSSLRRDDKIGCLTVIYDTEKVGKIYMPTLRKRQDWAMKLKVLQKCNVAFGIKEPLAYYRLRENSISHNKRALVKYNIAVYQEIFGWSKIKSTLYFLFAFMPTYIVKKAGLKYINQ
ncbi:glycosyltransferase family 2 protein [Barnesiella sp. WM24]|uniref:glycosyltransferase family 2 protein n=1 Tax=Barnesiella sp. WM24 TaxID=2558278 RepID=UPI0010728159|nr:glycosyltransferase family 2 protein [Barnesiella sp. WM24]MDE6113920.1 glycosyltransferase [Muribaculum sp.]MDE6191052.1 glycosyltransferase [Muribaculum sp.]TFU94636.1 glycosyltransferase family 2 protein [Barnesiella sp. WM24]